MFFRLRVLHNVLVLLFVVNIVMFYYSYKPNLDSIRDGSTSIIFEKRTENREYDFEDTVEYKNNLIIPILVLSCKRPLFLNRTLSKIFQYHPERNSGKSNSFPVLVSHACQDTLTKEVIQSFHDSITAVLHYHPNVELLKEKIQGSSEYANLMDQDMILRYSRIADHYHTALNWTFGLQIDEDETLVDFKTKRYNFKSHKAAIIIEDDLDISSDIFEYFKATYNLLQHDSTLYCVSAWNDNGKISLIDDQATGQLYRTDVFPGLGWMLKRSLWMELQPGWPDSFWDEYLRKPNIRKGRQCIRPEISRTYTFGEIGASQSQFYYEHLQKQYLNRVYVNFSNLDLNYLISPDYYKLWLEPLFFKCQEMSATMLFRQENLPPLIKMKYKSEYHYLDLATMFDLFPDLKEGIPRMSYRGIVTFKYKKSRIYLYPKSLKMER